jgi:hypothetical protein
VLGDQRSLGALAGRGFERELLIRQRIGFAAVGDELVSYLAWRRAPVLAARRVGLLRADGRERPAGSIVFQRFVSASPSG